MARSAARARRSTTEWVIRAVLAFAAGVLGYGAVTTTLGYTLRTGDVRRAHRLAPSDGRIMALLARETAGPKPTTAARTDAVRLARQALVDEPINVVALATLAIDAELRNRPSEARRLLNYSQSQSRRDLETQLLAVEDAVGRGDVAGALLHYDIALRTSREAPDLLFPVLGAAIADPAVRDAVVRTLSHRPAWWGSFLDYVSGNGPDPRATASLMLALRRTGMATPPSADATIISLLAQRVGASTAWRYYAASHGGADPRRSRDADFTADPQPPTPFDWTPVADGGMSVDIQHGLVDVSAPAGLGGQLLQQRQVLPSGVYHLAGRSAGIDQAGAAGLYWVLMCSDGRELGRIDLPASSVAGGRFSGGFTVPRDCPVQTLALAARPSDSGGGLSAQILRAELSSVASGG